MRVVKYVVIIFGFILISCGGGGQENSTTVVPNETPPKIVEWAHMAAGNNHSLGLSKDGTLLSWGTIIMVNSAMEPRQIGSHRFWWEAIQTGFKWPRGIIILKWGERDDF